ncbi:MAG: AAA family ATPase [Deltaproteobacteria bacterium]|nr:MAG: AAA family ATPase [Deltaproteobacteria bacterium]
MDMIPRKAAKKTRQYADQYPVITITGPRQSGKTTLCKMIFPQKDYVSLEDVDVRNFAQQDPRGFLSRFPKGAVIDEIQRVPDLLSYIQTIVDHKQEAGFFILTGSQQFELLEGISQSLAGRTALMRLLPLTLNEAYTDKKADISLEKVLWTGFYPRIFDKKLNPTEAMLFYVNTYVERDLRMLINIKDLSKFEIFLKLCAGRTGQILNLSSLGNDCGINHTTAKSWISVLEASYIIKLLRPYYKNFNKRLVKSPKLYFLDTGLASFLLNIQNKTQMATHPLKGALFESFIISETLKHRFNSGKTDNLYYFRDNIGNEVDLVCDHGINLDAVEIKSGQTIASDHFKGLKYLNKLTDSIRNSHVVYGGDKSYVMNNVNVVSWKQLHSNLGISKD